MNNLVLTMVNGEPTVTSRQVAEDFGRELGKVHRSIGSIANSIDVAIFGKMFQGNSYEDQYGREQHEYSMNRDGWTLLAMGFQGAKAMQWKLKYIAAFNEMEAKLSAMPVGYKVPPQNYLECLKELVSATELLDFTQEGLRQSQDLIAVLEPKAKAFDVFLDAKGYYSVGTAAKMIGMGRNGLYEWLRNYCYLNDSNEPYQGYVNKGYFAVKGNATYVSPKGVQWLAEKFIG